MKRTTILLCAAVVAGGLVGCSSEPPIEPEVPVEYADLTGYSIVRPDEPDKLELSSAQTLKKALESVYPGIKLTNDFVKRGSTAPLPTNEISVGATNRDESVALLADLAPRDFVIDFTGTRVVILGGSPQKTEEAVAYFIENYISDDNKLILPKGEKFISRYDYPTTKIAGKTLSELTVRTDVEGIKLDSFKALVKDTTNHTPADSGANAIVFALDNKLNSMDYRVTVKDGNLLVEAKSASEFSQVLHCFGDVLSDSEFDTELTNGWTKTYKARLVHVSELDDISTCRIYATADKMAYKKGEKISLYLGLTAGGQRVACDIIDYTVAIDWKDNITGKVSGADGGLSLTVDCDGYGEVSIMIRACDSDGNPIKEITKFDEAVYVYPETFEGAFADEVKDQPSITVNGDEYKMTFIDNFDGTELDLSKWSYCPEQNRHDAGGFWDDSMTTLDGNGNLIISASIDEDGTPISGAIRSIGKFEQTRGYFEVRAKLQHTTGFWGAFWLMTREMGNNTNNNSAKDGAELDIFESFSTVSGGVNHAVHWDGYGTNLKSSAHSVYNKNLYDDEFHTYSMLWDENGYYFYIDGTQTWSLLGDVPGSCEVPCYMKITAEFGTWGGSINKTELPDCFMVDYVKVYEKVEK